MGSYRQLTTMFWKSKNRRPESLELGTKAEEKRESFPYERHCWLYVSSKYNKILFVPMRELDSVSSKEWPLTIRKLHDMIQETLDKWTDPVSVVLPSNDNWHSFNNSKAKNWTDDHYKLAGKNHLIETQVGQVVIDIFNACGKIRMN